MPEPSRVPANAHDVKIARSDELLPLHSVLFHCMQAQFRAA